MARVLIVEDEPAIAELIRTNLHHQGFDPVCVSSGEAAQLEIDAVLPDLILLDWMLPGESGLSCARRWRADARTRTVPILMLTARGDDPDRVAGLEAGVDDYLAKPFSTRELVARMRAVLRRGRPEHGQQVLTVGSLRLDPEEQRVEHQGGALKLGPTEFKLLKYLMAHPDKVHSRSQLLDRVWGDHVAIEERTVDVHVKRLRESLGMAGQMVQTVRGVGYRLSLSDESN